MFKRRYQEEIFEKLESQWERILSGKYENIEELLNEIYEYGKIQGYEDISEKLRFTEADKLALTHIRNYNFNLIRKLDGELRQGIKNQIFQGVIEGEHPNSLAPKIRDLGLKTLPNSTLSPLQRATMIARTETARAQNTGILQSYVNEGFTEVKILTAEDDNVCYLCLRNAYEFNDDKIVYSNRGDERVHNIQDMIKNKSWVPLHPNCRCTYVCVTGSRGEPPENPYVVNLINEDTHNWSYIHDGIKYSLQGNTSMSRVDFEEKQGVNLNDLDDESKAFFKIYTDEGDTAINGYLRGILNKEDAVIKWNLSKNKLIHQDRLQHDLSFDRALEINELVFKEYSRELEESIILCRRENVRFMGSNGETIYTDEGFTSTSIYEYAKKEIYGNELNYILVPSGTKIIYLEGITTTSEDYEVLFAPGIKLQHVEDLTKNKKVWVLT